MLERMFNDLERMADAVEDMLWLPRVFIMGTVWCLCIALALGIFFGIILLCIAWWPLALIVGIPLLILFIGAMLDDL